jgi:ABC-2 type transport system ATP-binding protein
VLDGVALTVARGSVTALLGRNGTGKTSLVRCLLGEQKPAAGTVRLFGREVWGERTSLMARVGVVPEQPDAPSELPPARLAAFCARLYPRWDEAGFRARLDRFEVPLGQPFGRLSKGQKGAVMLALALGHSPELLVLDDPTLGLDVVARQEVFREVIGDLADRGTTVFLTSHDLAGVEGVADRIAILMEGRLVVDEELEPLKARFARPLEDIFTAVTRREVEA